MPCSSAWRFEVPNGWSTGLRVYRYGAGSFPLPSQIRHRFINFDYIVLRNSCLATAPVGESLRPATVNMDDLSGQMRSLDLGTPGTTVAIIRPVGAPEKIDAFIQSAETSVSLARQVPASKIEVEDDLASMDISQVRFLHSRAAKLAEATHLISTTLETIKATAARSAVQRLVALECQSPSIERLLAYCRTTLIRIATKVLDTWNERDDLILSRIAEACYIETVRNGELDPDRYTDELDLPDVELRSWPAFWRKILSKCPYGSTLFDTQALHERTSPPRYLFRVFDEKSRGRNNENEAASQASVSDADETKLGLLSFTDSGATEMFFKHLKWRDFGCNETPDNLTSWTSSLLFATQYAVYRCQKYGTQPAHVKVCVVDTTKFPQGQFVRDIDLIGVYSNGPTTEYRNFFNFRLTNKSYHNGEYLSQGLVTLPGRSCVTSFAKLVSSGLYKLYPEFEILKAEAEWASRILELRDGYDL